MRKPLTVSAETSAVVSQARMLLCWLLAVVAGFGVADQALANPSDGDAQPIPVYRTADDQMPTPDVESPAAAASRLEAKPASWCVLGVGPGCVANVKDRYGRNVRVRPEVRSKLWSKHQLTWATARWMIGNLKQVRTERAGGSVDTVYEQRFEEWVCGSHGCVATGQRNLVHMVVSFSKGADGKTIGLKTIYCVGHRECPYYINYAQRRREP